MGLISRVSSRTYRFVHFLKLKSSSTMADEEKKTVDDMGELDLGEKKKKKKERKEKKDKKEKSPAHEDAGADLELDLKKKKKKKTKETTDDADVVGDLDYLRRKRKRPR